MVNGLSSYKTSVALPDSDGLGHTNPGRLSARRLIGLSRHKLREPQVIERCNQPSDIDPRQPVRMHSRIASRFPRSGAL
jgi:hypothetical protein